MPNDTPHSPVDQKQLRAWFGRSAVVDGDGNPLLLVHKTKGDFAELDPSKTVDGGLHFGTEDQASMRTSRDSRAIRAYLRASKVRRCKDTGGNWRALIASAKRAGADAIVYLNRYEGMTTEVITRLSESGDLDRLDGLSDAQFRKLVPEAQDSFIAFSADQLWIASDSARATQGAAIQVVAYHGTDSPGFSEFDPGRVGHRNPGFMGSGFYFSDSPRVASLYGSHLATVELKLSNPACLDGPTVESVRRLRLESMRLRESDLTLGEAIELRERVQSGLGDIGLSEGMRDWFNDASADFEGSTFTLHNLTKDEIADPLALKARMVAHILREVFGAPDLDNLGHLARAVGPNLLTDQLIANGFDGIVGEATDLAGLGTREFVAFRPDQITIRSFSPVQAAAPSAREVLDAGVRRALEHGTDSPAPAAKPRGLTT